MKKYWHTTKELPTEHSCVILITKDYKILEGIYYGDNEYWIPPLSIFCPSTNFIGWCYRKDFMKEFGLRDFIETTHF